MVSRSTPAGAGGGGGSVGCHCCLMMYPSPASSHLFTDTWVDRHGI